MPIRHGTPRALFRFYPSTRKLTGAMTSYPESPVPEPRCRSMRSRIFFLLLVLLIFVSILEGALSSFTISWLHSTDSSTAFHFTADGKNYSLFGHPRHFILYHVYLANSAAICALIITGELSMIVVALIDRAFGKLPRSIYYLWFSLLVPTLVLTGVALVYVFAAEHSQKAQIINTALAVSENGRPYTRGTWTPHAWFSAVLGLDISALERKEILREVAMMKVWQYNLIPSE